MRTIKIDNDCNAWDIYPNEWKGYVYAPEEFDEVFVIKGNKDFKETVDASWYKKVVEYLEENDIEETENSTLDALKKLYPKDTFKTETIRGCVQREWQEVIYKANAIICDDINELFECFADFYFGYITEIYDEEENCVTYVAHSEIWKHEHKGDLKEYIRSLMEIGDDEDVKFIKSNGYITVKSWEEL